jgi:bifunctional non-homologous end joining protein LigD
MLWRDNPASVRPMLASTADAPLDSGDLAYEPKYDGIRAIVSIAPGAVRFWSRLGNEKTKQFPEIVGALEQWCRGIDRPLVLDGEIVALDERGEPAGFQNLQGRIHLKSPHTPALSQRAAGRGSTARRQPAAPREEVALVLFDILRDGDEDVRGLPLRERRARLEALFARASHPCIRLSEQAPGNGREMHARAEAHGWEGLIAKRLAGPYQSGRRTPEWRKLKLVRHQTCVIGGWTAPRGSRPFFGALLLGVYTETGHLQYVGHTGAGFSDAELGRVWKKLQALKTKTCPFAVVPKTNEKPYWVKPELVAEVKFTEWTADRKLRHPTYLGLRDDVRPQEVRKEPVQLAGRKSERGPAQPGIPERRPAERGTPERRTGRGTTNVELGPGNAEHVLRAHAADRSTARATSKSTVKDLLAQLDAIEEAGGNGVLALPEGHRLEISNMGKVFWPKPKLTKGDLFRHYVRVAPYILPALADRPLVMKRYPNGVDAKPFYQHRAPDKVPAGVRIEQAESETETRPHVIGGNLVTLLYTAQLASISQDPWFSRVHTPTVVDHVAIDLDPPDEAPFRRVLDVACWVREELEILKAPGFPKTSGSGGLHIYIPMPPDTPYEAGLLFCQIVATMVAKKHPRSATVERAIKARGSRIYVDYLQNIRGKTLASAYSPRASDFAGVSTPLTWEEVESGVSPKDFTVRTFAARLDEVGDLWAALRQSKSADLRAVMKYAEP